MTTIEFQPEFSHLRLDRADVDRLVGWTADPDFPLSGQHTGIISELQAAGAIDPAGELAAPLALALAAVADPICRLTLQLRDGQGRVEQAESWVSGDAAALLLPLPGERYEFGVTHPTFCRRCWPEWLAWVPGRD